MKDATRQFTPQGEPEAGWASIGLAGERRALVAPDAALAAAGRAAGWARLFVSSDTGEVLATDRYRPTANQRRRLIARDEVCRFPGCTSPARQCDIDHTHDYALGGRTEIGNLAALCERHHMMKHNSGWRVRQLGGGVLEWTSPAGRVYPDDPLSAVLFRAAATPDSPESPPHRPEVDPAVTRVPHDPRGFADDYFARIDATDAPLSVKLARAVIDPFTDELFDPLTWQPLDELADPLGRVPRESALPPDPLAPDPLAGASPLHRAAQPSDC